MVFNIYALGDILMSKSGVGISENFSDTRNQSVPKFFLAGIRYPSVP